MTPHITVFGPMTRRDAVLCVLRGEGIARVNWRYCPDCGRLDPIGLDEGSVHRWDEGCFGVGDISLIQGHPDCGKTAQHINVGLFIDAGLRALHEAS